MTHGILAPLFTLIPLAAFAGAQGAEPSAPSAELLLHLDSSLTEDLGSRAEVRAFRPVAVVADLLVESKARGAGHFDVRLFGDEVITVEHESSGRTASGGLVWTGRVAGSEASRINFAVHGDTVAGSLRIEGRLFRIAPDARQAGVHVLTWLDESGFMPCGTGPEHHVAGAAESDQGGGQVTASSGAGVTADVLVAYSPQARQAEGGTNGMLALIDLAMTETNQAYEQSLADTRLRLVGTHETNQNESSDMGQMLSRMRSTSDGWYDEVHPLRDQVGADFVAMIVRDGSYCGIGYLMTTVGQDFEDSAFTVTHRNCATGYYSFGHELGHNMGCHHDRDNAGSAAYPYSYGYRTPNNAWRTVMAYSPGTRIQYFSTPDVSFGGFPLGIAHPNPDSAHNARGIDEAAPTFAQWRCAVPAPYGSGMITTQGSELTLGWSGEPRENGAGNFEAVVSQGRPNQFGMLFYGTDTNDLPFFGGTLYVAPPLVRMPIMQVDGSGMASFDWIGHAQPSMGECYFLQFWQRDPGNPAGFNVAVSNGLRVDVCD